MKSLNIPTGKWQMVCWNANTVNGWERLNYFSDNQLTWEFQPNETHLNETQTNGILIESAIGESPNRTKYYYYPDEKLLAIDRSDYADDGYLLACIEEHFRIDFLSNRYVLLYDLEDVEVEPDDYA